MKTSNKLLLGLLAFVLLSITTMLVAGKFYAEENMTAKQETVKPAPVAPEAPAVPE
ncbi:hypothetical protein ACSX1A_15485 [Pontibacter sp. MBLB2868]|uniref:hypothetical protein n=1 Tax=Pontibacter sp. MBLB2868 TaxID=3451555 RepID=UPI003F755134